MRFRQAPPCNAAGDRNDRVSTQIVGLSTYQSGKWHLGARAEWGPNAYGFDHSYGTLTGAADPWSHKYRKGAV